MYWSGGAVQITNSTFFGNVGNTAAAIYFNGIDSLTITNSMFTQGSELLLQGSFDAYIKNSILANKAAGSYDLEYYNYFGTVYPSYTIIGTEDTDGAAPYVTNGVDGNIDIDSGTLASINIKAEVSENGSSNKTLSLALETGSSAINAGDATANNGVSIPTTDQRGQSRVSTVDIGPYEFQATDGADPLIISESIEENNLYVDITFDEGVYNTSGGTGGLEPSDFLVMLSQGIGDVTNVSISSLTKTDFGTLTGGETTVRATLSLTGTARGVETVSFSTASPVSIYDASGNALSNYQSTSALTLSGAFQYYVDPTGTDDGDHGTGTGTDAWATVQYAITNVANPTTAPIVINISGNTYTTGNDNIEITRGFTNLTLSGAGAATSILQSHADPASSTAGVLYITSTSTVTLEDLTIRYGRLGASGPAIQASSGDLTIRRVAITDNDTTAGVGYSGGISLSGNLTIENSTFTGNDGSYVSTIYGSGSSKTITITNSTFYGNGGSQTAGALYFNGPSVIITNSTFAQNGNILMQGSGSVYIKNSLLVDSTDAYDLEYYNYYGTVYPTNSMIGSEDTDGAAPYFVHGENGNLVNTGTLAELNIATSLADNSTVNGTQTLALSAGSIAINGGSSTANSTVSIPGIDQRGAAYTGNPDMGAYEYAGVISAPVLSSTNPADDATGIALDANLVIVFNEAVDAESGNISLYKSDDTLIEAFDVTADISGSGTTTIIVNPTSSLVELTSYYVQIDASAFDDSSSNSYAGISDETTWTFTSADTSTPTVSTLSPADNATLISQTANLVITFDEAVDVETGNITIKTTTGNTVFETIDVTSGLVTGTGTTTITINPAGTFAERTEYYVQIDTTAFDDTSSNSFAGITNTTSWSFTTGDFTNPLASTLTPLDDAIGIETDSNFVIVFSEAVDVETGNITLKKASDDSTIEAIDVTSGLVTGTGTATITINPTSDLLGSTAYYIQVDATAFDDSYSNSYAGITDSTSWTFTTISTGGGESSLENPPTVSLAYPNGGQTFTSGESVAIRWSTANYGPSSRASVYLSVDGGFTFDILSTLTDGITEYVWTVPASTTSGGSIKIVLIDGQGLPFNISDYTFSIVASENTDFSNEEGISNDESSSVENPTSTTVDEEGRYIAPLTNGLGTSPYDATQEFISSVEVGSYIRGMNYDTVYLVTEDNYRRPFWDAQTFFTYADSWDEVIWVTNATLSTFMLDTPLLPKEEIVLVKSPDNPLVYWVTETETFPTLHEVENENMAQTLFGAYWADYIIDIDSSKLTHYQPGSPVTTETSVDISLLKKRSSISALSL